MLKTKFSNKINSTIDKMKEGLTELDGQISFAELFPSSFISAHTDFDSVDLFFASSGFAVKTPEEFKAIPDDDLDNFIARHSSFYDWESMQAEALKIHIKNKLGL